MRIEELFSRPIDRKIEEVIKVDDESTILTEVEEYIPTDHIACRAHRRARRSSRRRSSTRARRSTSGCPASSARVSHRSPRCWDISLPTGTIGGKRLTDRFFELNDIPLARQLLSTIHSQIEAEVVLLDLATSPNVLREGEAVVLPVYRTLLESLGYSRDVTLAELEYALEGPDETIGLEQFLATYEAVHDRSWSDDRNIITSQEFGPAGCCTRSTPTPTRQQIPGRTPPAPLRSTPTGSQSVRWTMLSRRRPGKKRIVFIVDEAGQYVARSADRMLGLQGLAEACQKKKGALWLLATSQEKLTDVVDSLEGKQTELAKAVDRFPIRVDLLPSDI